MSTLQIENFLSIKFDWSHIKQCHQSNFSD